METMILKTRTAALAALLIPMLALSACDKPAANSAAGGDKYAGLDNQVLDWRKQILAEDPLCKGTADDQKCQGFEVACKAERTVTADDTAKGINARVVAAIDFTGWDPKLKQSQAGSRAAEFVKDAKGWTRRDHAPVNMTSCADL